MSTYAQYNDDILNPFHKDTVLLVVATALKRPPSDQVYSGALTCFRGR